MTFPQVRIVPQYVGFEGGLNQVNTLINCPPGYAIDAANFEVDTNGGYTRIEGYERFNGLARPSDAQYSSLTHNNTGSVSFSSNVTFGANGPTISGSPVILTGVTSGTSATIIASSTTQVFVTNFQNGTGFLSGEVLQIGGVTAATSTSASGLWGAPNSQTDALYRAAAMGIYRQLIGKPGEYLNTALSRVTTTATATIAGHGFEVGRTFTVSGASAPFDGTFTVVSAATNTFTFAVTDSGPTSSTGTITSASGQIRGIWLYGDSVLAFRDDASVANTEMYQSTTSGWRLRPYQYEVSFSNANTSVGDGDTLTQGAVSATILRVVVQTGTLLSGTNTGRLIISAPTGGNFTAAAASSTGGGSLTLSGAQTRITQTTGGRYEFADYAFVTDKKVYGCDGVNRGFEYGVNAGGTAVFVPIVTGMTVDHPLHVATHRNYLWFSFANSLQSSSIALPYQWSVITGASEQNVGDNITCLLPQVGSESSASMMIFCRNQISILYGTSTANFTRTVLRDGIGAMPYSAQNLGIAHALDDRGIIQMSPTLNWGNFDQGTISRLFNSYLANKKSRTSASCVNRTKNQYRVFFSDGSGIYATIFQGKMLGALPVSFDHPVLCATEGEFTDGTERTFFGSSDGGVYELDRGPSFDGGNLVGYLSMPFNSLSGPRMNKRYRKVVLDGRFANYTELYYGYQLGYGKADILQPNNENITMSDGYATWDTGYWDTMIWDGGFVPSEVVLDGTAENIQFIFQNNVNYVEPFTLTGLVLHYNARRLLR